VVTLHMVATGLLSADIVTVTRIRGYRGESAAIIPES
jgi:hypothetical protein